MIYDVEAVKKRILDEISELDEELQTMHIERTELLVKINMLEYKIKLKKKELKQYHKRSERNAKVQTMSTTTTT
jgi:seryl-tRNA synthetase